MRGARSLRRAAVALAVLGAVSVAPAATPVGAQAPGPGPGLPRTYTPQIIDSPNPISNGAFGWGVASADLTGDGELDLLVAQAQTGPGQVFIFDGVTGAHVDTINPPEQNPDSAAQQPVLGFVYVETMPDLGSCPGGDGPDLDKICDLSTIGAPDSIPEIIVGSRNLRVNATNPSSSPAVGDPRLGRGYVFDGATRAVLKRIDMPAADRAAQVAIATSVGTPPPGVGSIGPQFGRVMTNPSGLEPCIGPRGENNNFGVSPCPAKSDSDRIGDLNGGGQPDIVITARSQLERTGPLPAGALPEEYAAAGSQCRTIATGATCTSGKAWVYAGEQIAGTDPQAILDQPLYPIKNPFPQVGGAEFGGNAFKVGDLNLPGMPAPAPDGRPEFVIPARNLDYPLSSPDPAFENVGASFLFNGATGALVRSIVSPEPQPRSQFGGSFNSGRPVGDLGATSTPDFVQSAPLQNAFSTDDGQAWVFNGDLQAGGGAEQSWNFASLTDPAPQLGGNFGGSVTGVGNLVDGPNAPANEILIAGFGPFDPNTGASNNVVTDLHFMNPTFQSVLQTVPHPLATRGDGFGVGLTPMGDLNDDGFLDFAASAYVANIGPNAGQGRAYIFTSDNSALPAGPSQPPGARPVVPRLLKAGRCANETLGTNRKDRLRGTIAGDRMFGFRSNDRIVGYQSKDCLQGGRGADGLRGGADNDRLVGDRGNDDLKGEDGRDDLRAGPDRDRLSGGYGADLLAGGDGNDRLNGGPSGDRLFGERGDDGIVTGGGRNKVDAGPGNDWVDARNRVPDDIVCGAGRDTLLADRSDRRDGSCERVRLARRPAGG